MQGIAAKNILGLLLNLSAFVRRQKFWADWGINNVMQDAADLIIKPAAKIGYHLADHGFGQADIDVIACEMIAAKVHQPSASSDISPVPTTRPRQLFATSNRICVRSRACAFS